MNGIPKNKLEKFGLAIRCNRRRNLSLTKAAKWTQSHFCEGICSQNSLINIEKGKIGRFIENYPKLAERLELQVVHSDEIDKRIVHFTKRIYSTIEYYEFDKMRKYFDKLYELLDSVKDCLWYYDLYQAAKAVDNYYLSRKFLSHDDRCYYLDMIGEFSEQWDEIIKSIVYIAAYQNVDDLEYNELFKTQNMQECTSAFNKINIMLYYYGQGRTVMLLDLTKIYEADFKKQKNDLRLLDLYGIKLPFVSIHDAYEVDDAYNSMLNIMRTHKVARYKRAECYFSLGSAYLNMQEYEKALEAFETAYEYDDVRNMPVYAYLVHTQRVMGLKVKLPHYDKEDIEGYSVIYQKLYDYYSTIEKDETQAEKYIMTNIAPMIDGDIDKALLNLIGEELSLATNENNHHKIMARFNKKLKKTYRMVTNVLDMTNV